MLNKTFNKFYSLILLTCFATTSGLAQYCDAESLTDVPTFEFAISNVTFGTIDNDSDLSLPVSGGYEPYMGLTPIPDLEQGSTVPISITLNGPGVGLKVYVWVFIEWNGGDDFNDANEAFYLGEFNSTTPIIDNINVPMSAIPGNTRMRVVVISESGNIQPPCDTNTNFINYGEVEDYTINVTAAPIVEGLQINSVDTPFTLDFDSSVPNVNNGQFTGSGFSPTPNSGQLNSNAFIVKGLEDGDLDFGGLGDSGDFALGLSSGSESQGGIYAFQTSSNNFGLGIQPAGDDFTPGEIILRIQNKTGVEINSIKLNYKTYNYNDTDRANSFNFSYSLDNLSYIAISNLDYTSPETADELPNWHNNDRETSITGLSIPADGYVYFKWAGDDVSGSGTRDEFALDDISIRVNPIIPLITVSEMSISNLNYEPGNGPSASQSFMVSGEHLVDDLTIFLDVGSNFEISLDDSSFTNELTLNETSGVVSSTEVYVRLKPGFVEGNYSDEIELSSNLADNQFVRLNGRVKERLELFITEIANPGDIPNAKYVELFNADVDTLDLSTVDYHFAIEFNGGTSIQAFELTGEIPPKSYYLIDSNANTTFEDTYNMMSSNLPVSSTLGNGNDSYLLSTSGLNDENVRNTMHDIYGEIGRNGDTEPWNYVDSKVYRNNPSIKTSNIVWDNSEWVTISSPTTPNDMTPGYGDNDYIFDGDWDNNIYLSSNPDGVTQPGRNIFIKSGTVSFSNDTEIGDLVVRSGATLKLEPGVILNVSGDIVNEGSIIFESDETSGSAVLEATNTTRVVGHGFEVRRFIPVVQTPNPIRAFRYLSSSVDTQNSAKSSINENWQEGAADASHDPEPGSGTHITGSSTGENGFDATQTGNPSMFFWDPADDSSTVEVDQVGWTSIPSTYNTNDTFSVGDAYAILIRGDRSSPLDSNTAVGPSTTLRTTGQIHVGDFTLDSSELAAQDFFTLVGNPYQSQVDLIQLINNSTDIDNEVYIYDPTIGDLGTTVTIDLSAPFDPVPYSSANQYLQPNQAFFVKTIGPTPEINFTEDIKVNSGTQTGVFNETSENFTTLDISIKNSNQELQDGIRIVYGDDYSNSVNYDDATKLFNSGETIAVASADEYLSIEKRDFPTPIDSTNLNLYNLTLSNYVLSLDLQVNNATMPEVYLIDHYTGQNTLVAANGMTDYSFSVDPNIPESIANDRFQLSYNSILSISNFEDQPIKVYPNPLNTSDKLTISSNDIDLQAINSIELFNLQGQRVQTFNSSEVQNDGGSTQIDFNSTIIKGAYVLKIMTKENHYICKLIFN